MGKFRNKGPAIKTIQEINLPDYNKILLDNKIPLYSVSSGTQDIIKFELVFRSGRPFEKKKVVSRACNSMIKEGCQKFNSKEISDKIDFYGATLRTSENLDHCSIILFCLGKHFSSLLPIIQEVIHAPLFPEDELRKYINNNTERLKVELLKNDVIAYRKITGCILGEDHPYGYNSEISDYKALTQKDLQQHYELNYGHKNCQIFLSGKITSQHLTLCNKFFGSGFSDATPTETIAPVKFIKPEKIKISSDKEFQTAIKMGRLLFNRSHEDYAGFYFLNTVLGGYFGSRLMSNIREEKGYTYNIYSEVDTMRHSGLFLIGTEVSDEYLENTKKEIIREISILKTDLVPEKEMAMVRNYLLGRIMNFIDGPFNASRLIKSIVLADLDEKYFSNLIDTIKYISSERIRSLADSYLRETDMWTIEVGK